MPWTAPSAVYLAMLARGLGEAHGWDAGRITRCLAGRPGVVGRWEPAALREPMAGLRAE
ncbi:hypothetical protein GCM10023176_12520 [Micromonospora coerulea]|uniref:Uncharacterized protein n=1 Tax=Micromonospora coerulea TaxID=47856 RepID=A0ABP8SCF9_9ACTN